MSKANLATQRFTYTGADQFATVPAGVTHVEIKVWGAGGGGAGDPGNSGRGGGGGGFSTGTVAVAPGQRLLVVVGQGGQAGSAARTYGQGGAGSRSDYPGGSGGGLSGVFRDSLAQAQALVIAGGGGGATGTRNPGVGAGGGGGLSGSTAGRDARDGSPGTQTAGGVGGTGGVAPGVAGAALWGGNAGQNAGKFTMSGGGGGGGYWGGGGGVSQANSNDAHQIPGVGGGGSGYLASAVSGGVTTAGQAAPAKSTGGLAAGNDNPDYQPGVGNGGGSHNGGHGLVVLQWQVTVGLLQVVSGDGQTTEPSEKFADPLVVKACSADGKTPIAGTVVTFTVTEGDASFPGGGRSVSVTANGNGLATAPALTAGAGQGPVKVTAQAGGVRAVYSLKVTPAFEVGPGGPPDVRLVQGADVGYPGVRVRATNSTGPIGLQKVEVRLPAGQGLRWGTEGMPDYQLTVLGGDVYQGQLSADRMTLTFDDVDLDKAPGQEKVMWVAVSADHDASLGTTSLTFTVGAKSTASTPIVVTPDFTVSPGGSPVTAERAGAVVYPGVEVRSNGSQSIPLQPVTAVLPADAALRFGTPDSPDHQLTVWGADGNETFYVGSISDDGQTLSFSDVDLAIPEDGSQSVMWVCVSASDDTPHGTTSVQFTVGDRISQSTAIDVI
ncbi:hypothetical protein AB0G54_20385 [Streptomyces yokosukanensis]|uniref:hypothetical protein n=1 Tax=Streptomyces yokosukanensis TaxID=67386 RepID=UPI0034343CC0